MSRKTRDGQGEGFIRRKTDVIDSNPLSPIRLSTSFRENITYTTNIDRVQRWKTQT